MLRSEQDTAARGPATIARALSWAAVVVALLLLSCKEEIMVSSEDSLTDARYQPKVLVAVPALNSAGPYASWDPFYGYTMRMRFSKLMVSSSVRKGLRLASPERAVDMETYLYSVDPVSAQFQFFLVDSGAYLLSFPKIGEVFTLSASRPIVDVNGNALPPGVLGTIEPEPYFRVRRISPPDGTKLPTAQSRITLTFNSRVDSSIVRYITTEPSAGAPWSFEGSDSTALSMPAGAMGDAHSFAVHVAAGARDAMGNIMPQEFHATVFADSFSLVSFPRDTLAVRLNRSKKFSFNQVIDTSTVRAALHLSPDLEGSLKISVKGKVMTLSPTREYAPRTRYTITIDTSLRSANGYHLDAPVSHTFTTDAFRVYGTFPSDGDTGVPVGNDLALYFTARLDTGTVRRAFTIAPPTEGMISPTGSSSTLTFYLADTLRSLTTYTVTIDTSIRSQWGSRMETPFSFTFTTGQQ